MSRVNVLLSAASATAMTALVAALPAAAGDAYTTRIEPRGFYGATISIEEGVRVFRPLPPVRHVIVNPGGTTPLNLSFSDVRVQEHRTNTNYNYNYGDGGGYGTGYYGLGGGYYGGFRGHGGKADRGLARFPDGVGHGGHRGGHHGGKGGGGSGKH